MVLACGKFEIVQLIEFIRDDRRRQNAFVRPGQGENEMDYKEEEGVVVTEELDELIARVRVPNLPAVGSASVLPRFDELDGPHQSGEHFRPYVENTPVQPGKRRRDPPIGNIADGIIRQLVFEKFVDKPQRMGPPCPPLIGVEAPYPAAETLELENDGLDFTPLQRVPWIDAALRVENRRSIVRMPARLANSPGRRRKAVPTISLQVGFEHVTAMFPAPEGGLFLSRQDIGLVKLKEELLHELDMSPVGDRERIDCN